MMMIMFNHEEIDNDDVYHEEVDYGDDDGDQEEIIKW